MCKNIRFFKEEESKKKKRKTSQQECVRTEIALCSGIFFIVVHEKTRRGGRGGRRRERPETSAIRREKKFIFPLLHQVLLSYEHQWIDTLLFLNKITALCHPQKCSSATQRSKVVLQMSMFVVSTSRRVDIYEECSVPEVLHK